MIECRDGIRFQSNRIDADFQELRLGCQSVNQFSKCVKLFCRVVTLLRDYMVRQILQRSS